MSELNPIKASVLKPLHFFYAGLSSHFRSPLRKPDLYYLYSNVRWVVEFLVGVSKISEISLKYRKRVSIIRG